MLDRQRSARPARCGLERKNRIARRFGRQDLPVQRKREGAEPREQIGDSPGFPANASRTDCDQAASPSSVACRKAPGGNGTGVPAKLTVAGSGS